MIWRIRWNLIDFIAIIRMYRIINQKMMKLLDNYGKISRLFGMERFMFPYTRIFFFLLSIENLWVEAAAHEFSYPIILTSGPFELIPIKQRWKHQKIKIQRQKELSGRCGFLMISPMQGFRCPRTEICCAIDYLGNNKWNCTWIVSEVSRFTKTQFPEKVQKSRVSFNVADNKFFQKILWETSSQNNAIIAYEN